MTNQEFSNQFDVLYNNIMSNQAPGLDEYEKSVFLTKAQNEIVLSYFNPKSNKVFEGFDGNERRQIDFSMIMRTHTVNTGQQGTPTYDLRQNGVWSVSLPSDVLLFTNEALQVTRSSKDVVLTVVPISYTEYARQMSKPYKRPTHYQAWRLINAATTGNVTTTSSDIIAGPSDTFDKYIARYIKRPRAIILAGLQDSGVTLDDKDDEQTCELDPILHEEILQRAVELAKAAYTGDLSSQIALGTNSATEKGMLTQSNR